MTAYKDVRYNPMKEVDWFRATPHFKNEEYWLERLSPCQIAYLLVSATERFDTNESFFPLWSTIQDQTPDSDSLVDHCIGIPAYKVFFSFYMKVDCNYEHEDYSAGPPKLLEVLDDSFEVYTPEGSFEITENDFTREVSGISWKDFLLIVDNEAIRQYEEASIGLYRRFNRNVEKLKTKPFKLSELCKKLEEMDADKKKAVNIHRGKKLGLF